MSRHLLFLSLLVVNALSLDLKAIDELNALQTLHGILDENHDGEIDILETAEALEHELASSSRTPEQVRDTVSSFHALDAEKSVKDIQNGWMDSTVRGWSTEQVADWMTNFVKLPQYAQAIQKNAVDGKILPFFAANSEAHFKILNISDARHRTRIKLKALDTVLFGPPSEEVSYFSLILISFVLSTVIAFGIHFYHRQKAADMEKENEKLKSKLMSLDLGAKSLNDLDEQLTKKEKDLETSKHQQQVKEQEMKKESERLSKELDQLQSQMNKSDQNLDELKEENKKLKRQLGLFQGVLKKRSEWKELLQQTYDLETQLYQELLEQTREKKLQAEEKIKRLRGSLFGNLRIERITEIQEMQSQALASLKKLNHLQNGRQTRWDSLQETLRFQLNVGGTSRNGSTSSSSSVRLAVPNHA